VLGSEAIALINYSHYLCPHEGHESLDIKNNFDIKNILLLRDYKEAILSNYNMPNAPRHLAYLLCNGESHVPPTSWFFEDLPRTTLDLLYRLSTSIDICTRANLEKLFYCLPVPDLKHSFVDFLLPSLPLFDPNRKKDQFEQLHQSYSIKHIVVPKCDNKVHLNRIECASRSSPIYHYYLAAQLERYYTLLEYHDQVCKTNPQQAFLIRYEELIEDLDTVMNKFINFLKLNTLIDDDIEKRALSNLKRFIENLDFHKQESIEKYKEEQELNGRSIESDVKQFHSQDCSPQFLEQMTNVLKKKNPELFDKYLSDYEEKV
tara:strand:- start:767 stop:1720 length:954 start_codon:yes stop_codon:yes gene_type:complete